MKHEEKYINLELAKQIHAEHERLGIKLPENEWWWVHPYAKYTYREQKNSWTLSDNPQGRKGFPAYDTAELGIMLPVNCDSGKTDYHNEDNPKKWCATFTEDWQHKNADKIPCYGNTEADARGKIYLWLLQSDYIEKGDPL